MLEKYQKINNNYHLISHVILTSDELNNKNYLNISNTKLEIYLEPEYIPPFKIPNKIGKRCLSLVEWAYPPFGGGENWLLNFNKILKSFSYDNYIICFSDAFKNENFTKLKIIDLEYVKIIQSPKDILSIFQLIKYIDPDIINHQGINRLLFMKISNLLEIPFITGFCFWNNIINFNADNININMLENKYLQKTDEFSIILENSYTYVASNFVNNIIYKLYNLKLDVIETITLKDDFYVDDIEPIYVTLINCHYNKGGYLIKYLCKNIDINIPLQFVYTENDTKITLDYLRTLINDRNIKNNINILIPEKVDIKSIYKKTKIMLIPSLCDETFCRVAYEAMINNIPILSTKNGNLKYLLKDYAIFINDYDLYKWKRDIEVIYKGPGPSPGPSPSPSISEDVIHNKIKKTLDKLTISKFTYEQKNIGLILPWADQGLGIQGREYYITLKELGYNPHVFSFKPYHSNNDNIYLQTDPLEWNYKNVYYSPHYREDITFEEILDFIHKYKIKQIIIIEANRPNIFKIAKLLKLFNIKVYLVINIECIKIIELQYHNIFDKILTNNIESYIIMSQIFKNKIKYLGFNLNHQYFKNIIFCCIGGLNSISRKNIDTLIKTFFKIFKEDIYLNWTLNIYIQGIEIPNIINNYKCPNIIYNINNFSYKDIVQKYIDNDIFIHLGSHEGLGLGFYESLSCKTPVLTLNWTPNNEIIKNYINGWLIKCSYGTINDKNDTLINRAIIDNNYLYDKIIEIINDEDNTLRIINNIGPVDNKIIFEKNIDSLLST